MPKAARTGGPGGTAPLEGAGRCTTVTGPRRTRRPRRRSASNVARSRTRPITPTAGRDLSGDGPARWLGRPGSASVNGNRASGPVGGCLAGTCASPHPPRGRRGPPHRAVEPGSRGGGAPTRYETKTHYDARRKTHASVPGRHGRALLAGRAIPGADRSAIHTPSTGPVSPACGQSLHPPQNAVVVLPPQLVEAEEGSAAGNADLQVRLARLGPLRWGRPAKGQPVVHPIHIVWTALWK
jgi:hypothetical protein